MTVTQTGRNAALVGLLALIASLLPFATANAEITGDDTIYVLSDSNEGASIKQSRLTYTPLTDEGPAAPASEALIGTADVFADNLAAGTLSGQALAGGRPLFLNSSDDGVSDEILAELDRVTDDGATVHILGGELAQGEGVADALEAAGYTTNRFAGETRIETAIAISEANDSDTVLVVRGFPAEGNPSSAFADSMAAGALAATEGWDMLFTQTEVLTENTATALADQGYSQAYVVGGPLAISEDVLSAVGQIVENTERVSGETRFETAIALNELRSEELGTIALTVEGTSDDSWANAVASANWSGLGNFPLVLSTPDGQHPASQAYIDANHADGAPTFAVHAGDNFLACSGDGAMETCTEEAERRGGTASEFDPPAPPPPPTNQTIDVTPDEDALFEYEFNADTNAADDTQFSAANLSATAEYRVELFLSENVTIDENGIVTFEDAGGNIADSGGPDADLTVVNGAPADPAPTDNTQGGIMPVNGTVNATADADGPECYYGVFYVDGGDDTMLEIDDEGLPVEDFGVSGEICAIDPEAADNTAFGETLTAVAADGSYASGGGSTVFFTDGDTFRILDPGTGAYPTVDADTFFMNLSVDDYLFTCTTNVGIVTNYEQGGPNEWCLDDTAPGATGDLGLAPDATNPDTAFDATWTPVGGIDSQNIYLLSGPAGACEAEDPADYDLVENVDAGLMEYAFTNTVPSTDYCVWVASVSGQDESAIDAGSTEGITTADEVEPATILTATLDNDAVVEGLVDAGDIYELVFSESLAATAADNGNYINVTDADGDTARIMCAAALSAGDATIEATCALATTDEADDTLIVTILDAAEDAHDRNAAGDGDILYPLTITGTMGITDFNDGVAIDVDNSADVEIS